MTHTAVPLAIAVALGRGCVSTRLTIAGIAASMIPDADVLAFGFGIPYASDFGHRGFTHSLIFAIAAGLIAGLASPLLNSGRRTAFLFVAVAAASHGLLDMLTNGGLGVAYFWPIVSERFFFPYRPIEVSPIGIGRFLSADGLRVIASELVWVWLPGSLFAMAGYIVRSIFGRTGTERPIVEAHVPPGQSGKMTVYDLEDGRKYVILRAFTDYQGQQFDPGTVLTFRSRHFLPYEGGHTVMFTEKWMYLQEELQAEILDNFGDYVGFCRR